MTGRNITEFILELYNNPEMEFIYRTERYMISGYVDLSDNMYTLELWNVTRMLLFLSVPMFLVKNAWIVLRKAGHSMEKQSMRWRTRLPCCMGDLCRRK